MTWNGPDYWAYATDHEVEGRPKLCVDRLSRGLSSTSGVKAGRVSQPDPSTTPLARFAFLSGLPGSARRTLLLLPRPHDWPFHMLADLCLLLACLVVATLRSPLLLVLLASVASRRRSRRPKYMTLLCRFKLTRWTAIGPDDQGPLHAYLLICGLLSPGHRG